MNQCLWSTKSKLGLPSQSFRYPFFSTLTIDNYVFSISQRALGYAEMDIVPVLQMT